MFYVGLHKCARGGNMAVNMHCGRVFFILESYTHCMAPSSAIVNFASVNAFLLLLICEIIYCFDWISVVNPALICSC